MLVSNRQRVLLTRIAALAVFVLGVYALMLLVQRPIDSVSVSPLPTVPAQTHKIDANFIATHIAGSIQNPPPLPTMTPDPLDPAFLTGGSSWVTVAHFSGAVDRQDTPLFTVTGQWRIVWNCMSLGSFQSSGLLARLLDANGQYIATVAHSGNEGEPTNGAYIGAFTKMPLRVSVSIIANTMDYDFTVQEHR